MKILIVGSFKYDYYESAWAEAFKSIGHKIFEFGYEKRLSGFGGYLQSRFLIGTTINKINNELITYAKECSPDIILFHRALLILPETIDKIKVSLPLSKLICYQNDSVFGPLKHKMYWRHFKHALPKYDCHFVYRDTDVIKYTEYGAKKTHLLMSHYLPWLHRPMTNVNKSIDIGFYGHCEPDSRLELMSACIEKCYCNIEIKGIGWDKYSHGRPWQNWDTQAVYGNEYVKAINSTKICLCFLSSYNEDLYTRRCFEIPACNSLLLAPRNPTLQKLFAENQEIVLFDNQDELIEKIQFYLKHEAERERISFGGYERCNKSGYSIVDRANEMLAIINKI